MVKPFRNLLLRNRQADFQETWYVASGTPAIIVFFSNDDPRLTLTYFTARPNLVTRLFHGEKVKTEDFSETIAACVLKVGRCRQLIEIMKVCEY